MFLDGAHLITEALAASIPIERVMLTADARARDGIEELVRRLEARGVEILSVPASVMAAVSSVRSSSVIVAVAGRPRESEGALYAGTPLIVIAYDVQDPGNLGAIVRATEAAGGTGVIVSGRSADPFGAKALRGSMGSALRLPVIQEDATAAVPQARRHGCRVLAAVPRGGRSLFELDLTGPAAVLIGGEGSGLAPALERDADERFTIPMQPCVESLNAAVTAALVVYEAYRQRQVQYRKS
jgi:TrmH family RNA methyltransferase